jgi:hypothetical protein
MIIGPGGQVIVPRAGGGFGVPREDGPDGTGQYL